MKDIGVGYGHRNSMKVYTGYHPIINMLHQMTNFVDEMSGTMLR